MKKYDGIIISDSNRDRITREISATEGRATARLISAQKVLDACESIKRWYNVSMAALEGCRFEVDINAQHFPRAYKYTPESTHFIMCVAGGKWRLLEVKRCACTTIKVHADLTKECREAILQNYLRF
jgi:hypothetical protein